MEAKQIIKANEKLPQHTDKNLGVKIVSGRSLGLTDEEGEGAYVFCITADSVASQLHEELHEGTTLLSFDWGNAL